MGSCAGLIGSAAVNLQDTATAVAAFNRVVASNAIPDADKPQMLYLAMALNAHTKDYAAAVRIGEMLQALGPLDEKSSVALAQSYYNKGDYPNALKVAADALARGVNDPSNRAALLEKAQPLGLALTNVNTD